jgi:uncharacterized protein HemY
MPLSDDAVINPGLTTEKPVTKVNQKTRQTKGEVDFNTAVIIVGVAWAFIIFIYFSLRNFNI